MHCSVLIAKQGKWQFVVKTCRLVRSVAVVHPLCWSARYLKSWSFLEHAEIQENAIRELCAITESAFQEAFQQWKKRWERCIASRGDYSEGDNA